MLDTLRELKLDRNTLVIFTSDNGGTPRAVNAPLRGFKGSTWEGGMRVPTIAWWPGKIPAGTATDADHRHDRHPAHAGEAGRRRSCPPTARSTAATSGRCWPASRTPSRRTTRSTTTAA